MMRTASNASGETLEGFDTAPVRRHTFFREGFSRMNNEATTFTWCATHEPVLWLDHDCFLQYCDLRTHIYTYRLACERCHDPVSE